MLAGQGFINLTLRPEFLAAQVNAMLADDRLGVAVVSPRQRVVIDYSSPNVAKEMRVWHLRSTVLGDCLARVLDFAGYDVIRQNHLGDWGTQFGMLIEHLLDESHDGGTSTYRQSPRSTGGPDPGSTLTMPSQTGPGPGSSRSRPATRRPGHLAPARRRVPGRVRANVRPARRATHRRGRGRGEQLQRRPAARRRRPDDAGLLTESHGALCAFPPGFTGRDGSPLPLIVRKADGGFGYDATDLAAVRHRVDRLAADRLIYVVDARQSLHFDQVFALARAAGWLPDTVQAEHVAFGTVLGADGKPLKSRSGQSISLSALLDQAEQKAAALLDARGSDLAEPARSDTAGAIGVGAVKYADLVNDLGRDYVFAVDRMVAMDGNTGPYLQYAHARLCSLIANASDAPTQVLLLEHPEEQRLALLLIGFAGTVGEVASTLVPHRLCGYLHQVASAVGVL